MSTSVVRDSGSDPLPMPRCCDTHCDWTELAEHLIDRFPEVPAAAVIRQVTLAKTAVDNFGLPLRDQLETGEVIARHGLLLSTGQLADAARLDPETHTRR